MTNTDGETVNVDDYVHRTERGRWVVAHWSEGNACYIASMTSVGRRLTGCSQVSARSVEGIARDGNVATYASRASAVRAATREYGWGS